MPLLLSLSAAATELGVGRDYLRGLIADGHLPIVLVGREERVYVQDIIDWINRVKHFRLPCLSVDAPTPAAPGRSTSASRASGTSRRSPDPGPERKWLPGSGNGGPNSNAPPPAAPIPLHPCLTATGTSEA